MRSSSRAKVILSLVPLIAIAVVSVAIIAPLGEDRSSMNDPIDALSATEIGNAAAAWEAFNQRAKERLSGGDDATVREMLDELLAFEKQYKGAPEAILALFNHGQLAVALGELEVAEQSLRAGSLGAVTHLPRKGETARRIRIFSLQFRRFPLDGGSRV